MNLSIDVENDWNSQDLIAIDHWQDMKSLVKCLINGLRVRSPVFNAGDMVSVVNHWSCRGEVDRSGVRLG